MKKSFLLILCLFLCACAPKAPAGPTLETAESNRLMAVQPPSLSAKKQVGLVAHDACKPALLAWVKKHADILAEQNLFCTGTTGRLVEETLNERLPGKSIHLTRFNSGPLGGDQQMGARIAEGGLDILIFFIDPMSAHPHDVDIKALMRLSAVHNIVVAFTPATADYLISSPLFTGSYQPEKSTYSSYTQRALP